MYFMETFSDLNLLNIPSKNGNTCLQIAIENLSYKLLIYLLENGASPNAPNTVNGDTSLGTAVRLRDLRVAALLSKYGAHSNVFNFKNETPFTIAAQIGDLDMIELLAPNTQRAIRGVCGTLSRVDSTMSLSGLADAEGVTPSTPCTPQLNSPFGFSLSDTLLGEVQRENALFAIQEMQRIMEMKASLPVLEGWLERFDGNTWQNVWVVIKGSYLLWSKQQLVINDPQNIRERRQFDKYVNMMSIQSAKPVDNEHQNCAFTFVDSKMKKYLWRSMYEEDRDFWLDGLGKYRQCLKQQIHYLSD